MNQSKARQCRGKARHASKRCAEKARRKTGDDGGALLESYPCRYCGGFHIGHAPKPVQKRLRQARLVQLIEMANGFAAPSVSAKEADNA